MGARFCFFFLFCSILLTAQETVFQQNGNYLTFGLGIPINTVRDQAHSPLAYRGSGLRFFSSFERIKGKRISRVTLSLDNISLKAYVKPKQDVRRKASMNNFELGVGYYRQLGDRDDIEQQQYWGISYEFQLNNRQYPLPANNINGFLIQSSLGVAFMDRRNLETNKWTLSSRVRIPLLSAIYRPGYIGLPQVLNYQKPGFKEVIKGFRVGSFDQLFKISASFDFDYQLKDWRSNRYTYDWSLLSTPFPKTKPLLSTTGALLYGYRVLL